jgi:hypothetical protein
LAWVPADHGGNYGLDVSAWRAGSAGIRKDLMATDTWPGFRHSEIPI